MTNRTPPAPPGERAKPQAWFTVTELATMAGVSRRRMQRLLETNKVHPKRTGGRTVVFLYQLRNGFPELWYSLKERAEL